MANFTVLWCSMKKSAVPHISELKSKTYHCDCDSPLHLPNSSVEHVQLPPRWSVCTCDANSTYSNSVDPHRNMHALREHAAPDICTHTCTHIYTHTRSAADAASDPHVNTNIHTFFV